jgi:hypothetical protein
LSPKTKSEHRNLRFLLGAIGSFFQSLSSHQLLFRETLSKRSPLLISFSIDLNFQFCFLLFFFGQSIANITNKNFGLFKKPFVKTTLLTDWHHLLLRWLFPMHFLENNKPIDIHMLPSN